MPENLSSQLEEYLPQQILKLVKGAGEKASELGLELYVVGGVVRDLLLGRANFDLDLVVEGDAVKLAQELAKESQASLTVHPHFGTAKLSYTSFSFDIATARRESYSCPGALPSVKPGSLTDDLCRRDFSINTMALCLTPQRFGELIDLYHGKDDLDNRLIRILHPNSFIDDATRILRGLRYEQRLGFKLEAKTAELLRRDEAMLDTISGDRLRHELELILKEDCPERVLKRAAELGVLTKLHPSLRGNGWLSKRFEQARQQCKRTSPLPLYLCLLIYNLTDEENEQFLSRFNFQKRLSQAMRHALQLKTKLHTLANPQLKPSDIYQLLCSYTTQAIQANFLAAESPIASQHLQSYLAKLRYVKPLLNGEDLKRMGVPQGTQMGEILNALHEAKLNGEVRTREEEEKLVYNWCQTL
ncbi:MAG: CCA tRNA nucleotidyltransferase [Dehalococcoidia bacterium]|nr:MAG: CCA tRNA nucleotidyltransferase [Dehalococcoidia bacterium]